MILRRTIITSIAIILLCCSSMSLANISMGPESVIGFASGQENKIYSLNNNSMLLSFSKPYVSSYLLDPTYDYYKDFSCSLTRQSGRAFLHMSFSHRLNSSHQVLGYSLYKLGVNFLHGNGDGILSSRFSVNGIAPNFFHGSVLWPYEYTGASVSYSLTENLLVHSGNVMIDAQDFERRSVYYGGFNYKNLAGTISTVKLADDTVGNRVFFAYQWQSFAVAYQEYNSHLNSKWREVGLTFQGDGPGSWHLNLGHGTNDYYEEVSENRVMLTFTMPLGGDGVRSARQNSGSYGQNYDISSVTKQFNHDTESGISALATGLVLSSGSLTLDSAYRYETQNPAAYYILSVWNPVSVSENREYGGIIYRNRDMTYSPGSDVIQGTIDSVSFNPYELAPTGTTVTADWHTHGATMEGYVNEAFSTDDISFSDYYQLDGYLGTPEGRMFWYNYSETAIYQLLVNSNNSEFILPN